MLQGTVHNLSFLTWDSLPSIYFSCLQSLVYRILSTVIEKLLHWTKNVIFIRTGLSKTSQNRSTLTLIMGREHMKQKKQLLIQSRPHVSNSVRHAGFCSGLVVKFLFSSNTACFKDLRLLWHQHFGKMCSWHNKTIICTLLFYCMYIIHL